MGCRKNAPGKPCCETPGCTFDRNDLPEEFTINGVTILKSEWIAADVQISGAQYGCCWGWQIPLPVNSSQWEFYCSTEATIVWDGITYATKLVAYRVLKQILVNISRTTMVCDGGPSTLQYYVSIDKYYGGRYGNALYYPPSPSCQQLVFSIAFSELSSFRFDYHVPRSKAFTTLPTGSYTIPDGSDAICTPTPLCYNFGGGLTSVTIENTSTGQSIVFDDTEAYEFDIVF